MVTLFPVCETLSVPVGRKLGIVPMLTFPEDPSIARAAIVDVPKVLGEAVAMYRLPPVFLKVQ